MSVTPRTEGLIESVDTIERRETFDRDDRAKLLELRARVEEESRVAKRVLARTSGHGAHGRFIGPDQFALMQDNVKVLGARILRVQDELTVLRDQARREADLEHAQRTSEEKHRPLALAFDPSGKAWVLCSCENLVHVGTKTGALSMKLHRENPGDDAAVVQS